MATLIPPLNAGSTALGNKTCRGQRHEIGTGGERGTEWRGEQKGSTGGGGREQARNGKRGVVQRRGGKQGGEEKSQPLVGSVKEYRGFYEGGSAD